MSNLLGTHKDIEKAARRARKQGWDCGLNRRNHLRFVAPDGTVITGGLTPCESGAQHFLRKMRKAGYRP